MFHHRGERKKYQNGDFDSRSTRGSLKPADIKFDQTKKEYIKDVSCWILFMRNILSDRFHLFRLYF